MENQYKKEILEKMEIDDNYENLILKNNEKKKTKEFKSILQHINDKIMYEKEKKIKEYLKK